VVRQAVAGRSRTRGHLAWLAVVFCLPLLAPRALVAQGAEGQRSGSPDTSSPRICPDRARSEAAEVTRGGGDSGQEGIRPDFRTRFFPPGDLFSPLLADMKEPRFYGSFRSVSFDGPALPGGEAGTIAAALVALGERLDLWGARREVSCEGLHLGIFGSVFSQFNLDAPSSDLINSDFTGGLRVTGRIDRWSTRLRILHQSSHLGDEFLLNNPGVNRENLSFETVDGLVSMDGETLGLFWRVYGGGGYIVSTSTPLDRGMSQWGIELSGPAWALPNGTDLRLQAGGDFQSWAEQDWETTASLKGGVEWADRGSSRRVRFLFVYLNGFVPFGQFFSTTQLESYGIELQVNL